MKKCPKCGCMSFYVNAHVVQEWLVDENGDFMQTTEDCITVSHYPDDSDLWTCYNCSHEATGDEFEVHKVPHDSVKPHFTANEGDLVAVNGELYAYNAYDEQSDCHIISTIDVDEIGNMTDTRVTLVFSDEEMRGFETRDAKLTDKEFKTVVNTLAFEALNFDFNKAEKLTDALMNAFAENGKPPIRQLKAYIKDFAEWGIKEEE